MSSLVSAVIDFLTGLFGQDVSNTDSSPQKKSTPKSVDPIPSTQPHPTPRPRESTTRSAQARGDHHQDPATSNRPSTSIREASIADALAHASYQPVMDGDADPGEVVWTWVPYQEDTSVGKDRPAVVIGAQGEGVYILQLTSKDHTQDAAQEAAAGRYWFNIGTGAWDSKGRPSEVRLDRALWVKATDVRREGSILPEATWRRIVDALEDHHRRHGA